MAKKHMGKKYSTSLVNKGMHLNTTCHVGRNEKCKALTDSKVGGETGIQTHF